VWGQSSSQKSHGDEPISSRINLWDTWQVPHSSDLYKAESSECLSTHPNWWWWHVEHPISHRALAFWIPSHADRVNRHTSSIASLYGRLCMAFCWQLCSVLPWGQTDMLDQWGGARNQGIKSAQTATRIWPLRNCREVAFWSLSSWLCQIGH